MSTESRSNSDREFELSLWAFAAAVARRRRVVALAVGAVTILTAARVSLRAPEYTVRSALMSTAGVTSGGNGLAGLAQAAGLNLSANPTNSPEYYAELIQTEDLLRNVAEAPIDSAASSADSSILAALIVGKPDQRDALVKRAVTALRGMVLPSISQKSSIVTLSVKSKDPQLSLRIATVIVRQLELINQRARASQNAAEAAFIELSLRGALAEVTKAEGALQAFLEQHRSFTDPAIEIERQRVLGKVEVARGTYVSLAGALDRARIESLRNTPTINVLEPPRVPLGPDPRGLIMKSVLAAFAALLGMLGLVLVGELLSTARSASPPQPDDVLGSASQ